MYKLNGGNIKSQPRAVSVAWLNVGPLQWGMVFKSPFFSNWSPSDFKYFFPAQHDSVLTLKFQLGLRRGSGMVLR